MQGATYQTEMVIIKCNWKKLMQWAVCILDPGSIKWNRFKQLILFLRRASNSLYICTHEFTIENKWVMLIRGKCWQFNFEKDHFVDLDFLFLESDHKCFGLKWIIQYLGGRPLMIIPIFDFVINSGILTFAFKIIVGLSVFDL